MPSTGLHIRRVSVFDFAPLASRRVVCLMPQYVHITFVVLILCTMFPLTRLLPPMAHRAEGIEGIDVCVLCHGSIPADVIINICVHTPSALQIATATGGSTSDSPDPSKFTCVCIH